MILQPNDLIEYSTPLDLIGSIIFAAIGGFCIGTVLRDVIKQGALNYKEEKDYK